MKFRTFSEKQLRVLCWWCPDSPDARRDALICDGAVRSGKTLCMSLSFVFWAFHRFHNQSFAICGKTIVSLRRNMITPLLSALKPLGFHCVLKTSQNILEISRAGRFNRFYLFGGKDESSAALIQGMTLAGVLFDEVALMPRSFVEQALARCSVTDSKFWFNCNPEHPRHWFYREWILKKERKNVLYLHFTMADNPSLPPEILKRYESLYSGVFYERFVKGLWVAAQGLVYPMFRESEHVRDCDGPFESFYISCDYGTVNPASFGLWGLHKGCWYRIAEYYHDSRREGVQLTDDEYYQALETLAGDRNIEAVLCDPSAASFIAVIRKAGRFRVLKAKNEVLDGIRKVSAALKSGKIAISPSCTDSIREFSLYSWEDGGQRDLPKKENDHAMDDIRYFVSSVVAGEEGDGVFAVCVARQ